MSTSNLQLHAFRCSGGARGSSERSRSADSASSRAGSSPVVVDAVSDNDDSDSEDMLVSRERQEQVAGAGSLWSCTVCTVSIGVVLFSSFYFKCLTFVLIHVDIRS